MLQEIQSVRTGSSVSVKGDQNGESFVADSLARYYSMVRRGNVFFAANQAVQALSVNNATATGLILSNPVGSGKNLVLLEVCVALASVPGAISELILTGNLGGSAAVTHTAALTVQNSFMGTGSPRGAAVGLMDNQATIPASPTIFRAIGSYLWIATAANVAMPIQIKDEVAGAIVIGPGCVVSLQALTTAISVVASMTWAEEPL